MAFIVSQKESEQGVIVVVTDSELLGKEFSKGKAFLDLKSPFYQGDEMEKDKVKLLFNEAKHVHLTGKESVALGVELDLVDSDKVLWVEGIPHAEVVIERG